MLSDGVVGSGRAFFEQVAALELEGIVAKSLKSPYQPGRRTGAWTKIKKAHQLHCAIVGFVPDGEEDFKSLIIAAASDSGLVCVGRVGGGISTAMHERLRQHLFARLRPTPLIDCGMDGRWVEPGLFCVVSYLERTSTGTLRAPVFLDLVEG